MIKDLIKKIIYQPRNVIIGDGSYVLIPRWFSNPQAISIGNKCTIGRCTVFNPIRKYSGKEYPGEIIVENNVYIGGFTQIHAMNRVVIGTESVLSEYVYISDTSHGLNPMCGPIMGQPLEFKGPVNIGKSVFIGYGASILPGVTLGDHCVVAAKSVVTKSFPKYSMVAGTPAKLIKVFNVEKNAWLSVGDSVQ